MVKEVVSHILYMVKFSAANAEPRRTVNGPGGGKIKTWICREKRKGTVCKGRNVKEEELLKYGDAKKIVIKGAEIEIL